MNLKDSSIIINEYFILLELKIRRLGSEGVVNGQTGSDLTWQKKAYISMWQFPSAYEKTTVELHAPILFTKKYLAHNSSRYFLLDDVALTDTCKSDAIWNSFSSSSSSTEQCNNATRVSSSSSSFLNNFRSFLACNGTRSPSPP